jgi:hypothetical protein
MKGLSQKAAAAARRPWTSNDQQQAEAMFAMGLCYAEIARRLDRNPCVVRCKLNAEADAATKAAAKRYREAHREEAREYARARYHANIEQHRQKMAEWRRRNPEKMRAAQRRWHLANPEKKRENQLRSYRSNLERSRENVRRRSAFRRSARRLALNPVTREAIDARFALFQNCCAYCGSRKRITIDHVLALNAGGLDEIANTVPACCHCNSSKRDRAVDKWYRSQPFYSDARWRMIAKHCPQSVAGQLAIAIQRC